MKEETSCILDGKVTLWVIKTDTKTLLLLRVMITELLSHLVLQYRIPECYSRIWYCTCTTTVGQ